VITGGSSGLGLCVAKEILKTHSNCKITLIARNLEKLKQAKKMTGASSDNVYIQSLDVSRENAINVDKTIRSLDPDVLICCAGTSEAKLFEDHSLKDFTDLMDLNFYGTLLPIKAVVQNMKKLKRGRIAVVSSVAGQLGVFGFSAYSSSKFALNGLCQVLSSELRPHGIGVTISFPPDMDTPGYQEEMKRDKPWECHEISKTAGLLMPEPIAEKLWRDILAGNYLSVTGMDAWASSMIASGWNPQTNFCSMVIEIILSPIFKLVAWGHLRYFEYIVTKGITRRNKNN